LIAVDAVNGGDARTTNGRGEPQLERTQMNTTRVVATVAAFAVPTLAKAGPAATSTFATEKCFGIAARGANGYQTPPHSCAGQRTGAKDPASWIYGPGGTCTKIDGGSATAKS
jgi:uncharacterized membrane protein